MAHTVRIGGTWVKARHMKTLKLKKKRCRHTWTLRSHLDFKDGEYLVCTKCGKVKFS